MTKSEIETIRNVIARLKKHDCGCSHNGELAKLALETNRYGCEMVSRLYLDTWIISALECLLPESRDVNLAVRLSD